MGNAGPMIISKEKFWITLNGQSMSPLLQQQDEILIEPISLEKIKLGDIILFQDKESSELTIHRLIAFPFTTKGDFSLMSEENCSDCYLGRAVGFKRKDRFRELSYNQKAFLTCSILRMSNFIMRKVGLFGLIYLTTFFEFYNAISKSDHTKELP